MYVDEDNVLSAASRHAQEFYEWSAYVVRLEAWVEAYANGAENTLGPLREAIRDELILSRGKTSLTEKAVSDSLRTRPTARAVMTELLLRKKKLKLAKAVLAALDKKTEMIKSIAFALNRSNAAGV